jgi:hypothetical protein
MKDVVTAISFGRRAGKSKVVIVDNKPRWDVHVEVAVNRCLSVGRYVVNLAAFKTRKKAKDEGEAYSTPTDNWGICGPKIYSFNLHTAMWTQT